MNRYIRNLKLDNFDQSAQDKISSSKVLIIGAGALGQVVAMYLAGAGTGTLLIADFDTVDLTNLQRQVFFTEANVGSSKSTILAQRVAALNSTIKVYSSNALITSRNIDDFASDCDVIVECSDNPATKQLAADYGRSHAIPVVLGGVNGYNGQVSVFTGKSPDFGQIFPAPTCNSILPCSAAGVFSSVPGIVGSIQAAEVLKLLTGIGKPLENKLLSFDSTTMQFQSFEF